MTVRITVKTRSIFNADTLHLPPFPFYRAATEYYGCSKKAGTLAFSLRRIVESQRTFRRSLMRWIWEEYTFDPQVRGEVRKELKIENKFVVGHVGSFSYAKNHYFLIHIFEEILARKILDAVLACWQGMAYALRSVKSTGTEEKGLEESVRILRVPEGREADCCRGWTFSSCHPVLRGFRR